MTRVYRGIIGFADDMAVIYESENLKTKPTNDFKYICDWFKYNKLTLKSEKMSYLPFTSYTNHLSNLGLLKIDDVISVLERDQIKYLGIIIDRHLRWYLQIKYVTNKLRVC